MSDIIKNRKVLVVDDDPFVRELICDILKDIGATTIEANHGLEALKVIKEQRFDEHEIDLVISDIHMPHMDGISLVEAIRKEWDTIPIIILTVNTEMDTAIKAIRKGADDYLLKGSSIGDTLPLCVAKVMEFYALKRQNKDLFFDLSRKNAELERLAFLDALSGISNRRYYDATVKTEWEFAIQSRKFLAIIFTDIDEFKVINDTYGHQFGDLCIQHVARVLNNALSHTQAILSRYGGDEFVTTIPDCTIEEATEIAQRMHKKITTSPIEDPETKERIILTMSFGVSSMVPSENLSCDHLFETADNALYKAKQSGKNCVVSLIASN